MLRGVDLPAKEIKKPTIGQSKVKGLDQQEEKATRNIILDLLLRAMGRLRTKNLYVSRISVIIKSNSNRIYKNSIKIEASNDSLYLSKIVLKSWDGLDQVNKIKRIKKVAVSLKGLSCRSKQLTFFDFNNSQRGNRISKALDTINKKFGKNAISLGLVKLKKKEETPIAFRYIPDRK